MTNAEFTLVLCHLLLLTPLVVLGMHKAWMLLLWRRGRQRRPMPPTPGDLPFVTIQLPIFNERFVAERLLDAVAKVNYPRDRLEVQVLDDSTDDTSAIVEARLRRLPADLSTRHVRRSDRVGFKAGALAHGLESARGEFIAVFDADFLPHPEFLQRTIPEFADEGVGMVQARWGHTNREQSTLTQVQALLLDGHFAIEQRARANNRCFFNFNGTAGVFRRRCIDEAGGWQHDTLTEDMDLSYRAQLAGWRFVYLPDLACPAELPADMNGFLTQQHRWAKGSVQTGRKLLGRIFRAPIPWIAKVESVFHLLGNVAFPILLGLVVLALPLQLVRTISGSGVSTTMAWFEGMPLLLATLSVFAYYGASQAALGRLGPRTLLRLPLVLVLGAGASLTNTLAVFGALRRDPGEFKRTPKFNLGAGGAIENRPRYQSPRGLLPLLEIGLGLWALSTSGLALFLGTWATAAFHAMFASGFLWVGLRSLAAQRRYRALLPVAILAGCTGSGSSDDPIVLVTDAELVVCQSRLDNPHNLTEIAFATRQGLAFDDLSSRVGQETSVRVHPDGKRIVFARERSKSNPDSREIYTWSIDRSAPETRLTGNQWIDDDPCWSPDGKSITYSSTIGGDRDIWRIDPDGKNPKRLTSGDDDDRHPDWHTNGIVFSRDAGTGPARLFLVDANGSTPVALTNGGTGLGDVQPAWSPDGKSILFVRRLTESRSTLMLLTLGSGQPTVLGDGLGEDAWPRWSPSGDRIFAARSRPAIGMPGLRLYAMDPAGKSPLLVFPDQRMAYPGFDTTSAMGAFVAPSKTADVDVGRGKLTKRLGLHSRGVDDFVLAADGKVLGVATVPYDGREKAGVLLTLELPVLGARRIAAFECKVTAAITRNDSDSFVRLAIRNFLLNRYDSVVEDAPADKTLRSWTFATQSLAHVDRYRTIQLEIIGDISAGDAAELLIDAIEVRVSSRDE